MVHVTPQQIRTEPERIVADIRSALRAGQDRPALPIRTLRAEG